MKTIQGEVQAALLKLFNVDAHGNKQRRRSGANGDMHLRVSVRAASRTDAGVHARGQVVTVHVVRGSAESCEGPALQLSQDETRRTVLPFNGEVQKIGFALNRMVSSQVTLLLSPRLS